MLVKLKGVEMSTGSLGHGMPFAAGSLRKKMKISKVMYLFNR